MHYTCITIHLCVLLKLVMPKIKVTFSMYSASSLKAGRTFVKIISFASSSSFSLKIFQISIILFFYFSTINCTFPKLSKIKITNTTVTASLRVKM